MKKLIREISDKFTVFHACAWSQADHRNHPDGINSAMKSRTLAMELGALLEEWRKVSLENQADSINLP
jgi:hypothetical protein